MKKDDDQINPAQQCVHDCILKVEQQDSEWMEVC